MRNYVFFALVSQAVSETRRVEWGTHANEMSARCDPLGFSSLSCRDDPLPWQFYPFRSTTSAVTTTAQSPPPSPFPSPSLSPSTAGYGYDYDSGFSCLFFSAVAFVTAALYLSQWKAFLFCFAFAIHCQLPCAFCFPFSSSATSLPVYLPLCSSPAFLLPSCCGLSCLESFTFYCRIILSRLAQTQRFTTKSSSLVTLT